MQNNSDKSNVVQILSSEVNAAVVQMPDRRYPGIVIQGDSLQNILSLLTAAQKGIEAGDPEGVEILDETRELIEGYVVAYKKVIVNGE